LQDKYLRSLLFGETLGMDTPGKAKIYYWKPQEKLTPEDMVEFMNWFIGHKYVSHHTFSQVPDKFKKHFEEREVDASQLLPRAR
jgi:hypothetical protein